MPVTAPKRSSRKAAKADVVGLLSRGGEGRVALLRYCVMSMTPEPVFLFLVQEYRFRPTPPGALALYDVFCAPGAVARVRSPAGLAPRDMRLTAATAFLRRQWIERSPEHPEDRVHVWTTVPHRDLFDRVAVALTQDPRGALAALARRYDPTCAPDGNLPGGKLNAVQRHFVEHVWQPVARPMLVAAGFWQISGIG